MRCGRRSLCAWSPPVPDGRFHFQRVYDPRSMMRRARNSCSFDSQYYLQYFSRKKRGHKSPSQLSLASIHRSPFTGNDGTRPEMGGRGPIHLTELAGDSRKQAGGHAHTKESITLRPARCRVSLLEASSESVFDSIIRRFHPKISLFSTKFARPRLAARQKKTNREIAFRTHIATSKISEKSSSQRAGKSGKAVRCYQLSPEFSRSLYPRTGPGSVGRSGGLSERKNSWPSAANAQEFTRQPPRR